MTIKEYDLNVMTTAMIGNSEKSLVIWGIGKLSREYADKNPNLNVLFYIDSYTDKNTFRGRRVLHPDVVKNWKSCYVLVIVEQNKDIIAYLEKRGLIENEDFEIIPEKQTKLSETISNVLLLKQKKFTGIRPSVMFLPYHGIRGEETYLNFIREYVRGKGQCIVFIYDIGIKRCEDISAELGCDVIKYPDVWGWDGEYKANDYETLDIEKISENDLSQLKEIKERKIDFKGAMEYVKKFYVVYSSIVEILEPQDLYAWGGWDIESYILGYIAEKRVIPMGYLEHGWIGGTYQIDPCGIIGQGECAVHPEVVEGISMVEFSF